MRHHYSLVIPQYKQQLGLLRVVDALIVPSAYVDNTVRVTSPPPPRKRLLSPTISTRENRALKKKTRKNTTAQKPRYSREPRIPCLILDDNLAVWWKAVRELGVARV